jgi:hypothetical protein
VAAAKEQPTLTVAGSISKQHTTAMATTNNAFRGMDGVDSLFKSKAELKAEKAAAKEAKKLGKSKVTIITAFLWLLFAVLAMSRHKQGRQAADTVAAL